MRGAIMGGTSVIGLATARRLMEDGAHVIITGRDPQKIALVTGRAAHAERLDGTAKGEVTAFFARLGTFEHLVLAFSPGPVGLGPLRDISLADIEAAFAGKLFPYLFAIQSADVTGSITLISASTARAALPGTIGLAAVNGAIERIVSPLAAELAPVRVNAVSPPARSIRPGGHSFPPSSDPPSSTRLPRACPPGGSDSPTRSPKRSAI
jgi:NAD(P)-dependent dehydrogenase (short-subunit alcohol dehydrogenase family)